MAGGKQVAQGRIERTMGIRISLDETVDVASHAGEPKSPRKPNSSARNAPAPRRSGSRRNSETTGSLKGDTYVMENRRTRRRTRRRAGHVADKHNEPGGFTNQRRNQE